MSEQPHDSHDPFSIPSLIQRVSSYSSMGTSSTTASLTERFRGSLPFEGLEEIRRHNRTSRISIRSEVTGKEHDIPWCGSDRREAVNYDNKVHRAWKWWNIYGYGMRVDDFIHCTVKRRKGECFEKFSSSKGSSTSFRKHLENRHFNLTESRREYYFISQS